MHTQISVINPFPALLLELWGVGKCVRGRRTTFTFTSTSTAAGLGGRTLPAPRGLRCTNVRDKGEGKTHTKRQHLTFTTSRGRSADYAVP